MRKDIEYIAYEGESFTIEWYHNKKNESQAYSYYKTLSQDERLKLMTLFKKIADFGQIKDKTKFINEGDKIYAFKPQPERFLCFFNDGKKIIVTNAFRKKQQKLPKKEKDKAVKCRSDYLLRIKEGKYYDY